MSGYTDALFDRFVEMIPAAQQVHEYGTVSGASVDQDGNRIVLVDYGGAVGVATNSWSSAFDVVIRTYGMDNLVKALQGQQVVLFPDLAPVFISDLQVTG